MSASRIDELRAKAWTVGIPGISNAGVSVVALADAEAKLAECEQEKGELREKLVELALKLAAHETAEDRKRILESEDVRSIMDLRLR